MNIYFYDISHYEELDYRSPCHSMQPDGVHSFCPNGHILMTYVFFSTRSVLCFVAVRGKRVRVRGRLAGQPALGLGFSFLRKQVSLQLSDMLRFCSVPSLHITLSSYQLWSCCAKKYLFQTVSDGLIWRGEEDVFFSSSFTTVCATQKCLQWTA